jgi:hypothetical protein
MNQRLPRSSRTLSPVVLTAAAVGLLLCLSQAAWARAGGGGGHGGGAGGAIAGLIQLPLILCMVVYIGVLHRLVAKRGAEAAALLRRLSASDAKWRPEVLHQRIREVYLKVQEAWTKRDQEIARDCMSAQLFELHKTQTDAMIARHETNVLEAIELAQATIVGVANYGQPGFDSFWVYIEGSMIDYTVSDRTGHIIKGDNQKSQAFHELWKFARGEKDWVLAEIVQEGSSGIKALEHIHSFSRGLTGHQPLRQYSGGEA